MNRVIFGDCRDTMRDLKAQGVRVQCCVTSPPYFGLRDYGHPGQIGLEKTPAEYVAALVEVFEGVRELLADDGVMLPASDQAATMHESAAVYDFAADTHVVLHVQDGINWDQPDAGWSFDHHG